ncbi:BTAD domain-containing putative transcriptional regulator [Kitasatospora sp. YST-16]|uniref:AfsR/SARP family transcriptional regulator n=1 Tax=unclassified Kitasatospora TaxID=2633591 RepID=UPI001E559AD1|nr:MULTISPECIES: BTAD domain-containing putative transcriptional regulator [unclassified Kitasatospora]WAL72458.1 BTAD domain-containing putative transcriptional regulator [Kitasatospora sp. YST-16]WNW38509.1 BTAD domain-containing putative transcriptional regulator [Streptomyces sp. Li-HN-5-13]
MLGTLTVHDGTAERPIRGPKARTLLAVLLLNADRPVSLDRLVDALWGEHAPATAEASLRNLVARLRKSLADEDGTRLRATPAGYRLVVADEELDTRRFEAAVRRAHAAHEAGDLPAVLAETATALGLWRGEPLADLPEAAGNGAACEQWRESRLQALEWRFDAELRLGRPHALIPELTRLVGEHPLREAFHAQLIRALQATGDRARALAVHQRLRTALVEELGVEPGPAVREAHRRLLAEQPEPEPELLSEPVPELLSEPVPVSEPELASASASVAAERPRPAQLPSPAAHFVGRQEQLEALRRALLADSDRTAVAVVSGMAGVGKSALAVRCADGLRAEFPDGQLFLNLRGATPGLAPLTAHAALTALLLGLGTAPGAIPEDAGGAAALLRTALAGTRTLLVLDDAADPAQVRPLLPATPGCAVLVTGRTPMHTLDHALHLRLDALSERDSIALVERTAGRSTADRSVVAIEQADLARLVRLCGRLPLALRIAGARLAARRTLPVRGLVGRLEEPADRLDELELDDLSIRQSLALTHDSLRASTRRPDLRAADALAAIGAIDLPDYSAPLLSAVLRITPAQAGAALDRLVEVALLDEPRPDRYAPHDLVRDYARELVPDPEAHIRAALEWYFSLASRTAHALDPDIHRNSQLPPVEAADQLDEDEALALSDAEFDNLLALVEQLADTSWATADDVSPLVRALMPYLRICERTESFRMNELVHHLALRDGNRTAQVFALNGMAHAHYLAGRNLLALELLDQCLPLVDGPQRGRMQGNRGMLLTSLGRTEEATRCLEESLARSIQDEDLRSEAIALSALGNLVEAEDPHLALAHHRRSAEIGQRCDFGFAVNTGLANIGFAHLRLDDPAEALRHFVLATETHASVTAQDPNPEGWRGRAEALRRLGRLEEALAIIRDLLARTASQQNNVSTGMIEHTHGLILRDLGRPAEARAVWEATLSRFRTADHKVVAELRELLAAG